MKMSTKIMLIFSNKINNGQFKFRIFLFTVDVKNKQIRIGYVIPLWKSRWQIWTDTKMIA